MSGRGDVKKGSRELGKGGKEKRHVVCRVVGGWILAREGLLSSLSTAITPGFFSQVNFLIYSRTWSIIEISFSLQLKSGIRVNFVGSYSWAEPRTS